MVNLSAFQTMTQLTFNTSNITNAETLVPTLISTTDEVSKGYFGLAVMVAVFIVLLFITFKQDGDIRLDIMRSILISSGFSSILGLIMLVIGLSTSFVHLMWFLAIFIITILIIYNMKKKGL